MKKQIIIISGIVILVVIIVMLGLFYKATIPTEADISASQVMVKTVDPNIFSSTEVNMIQSRQKYGNLPVQVESNYNHTNLF